MPSEGENKTLLPFLIRLAQEHWHKPIGLLFTFAAAILFESIIIITSKSSGTTAIVTYLTTAIFVIIIWLYSNRIPKIHKGKVGFVVCIQCSNEEEQKVIRDDFIQTLRRLLNTDSTGHTFHFVEIPQHIAESINDTADALALRAKTKSHFLIFGRVRLKTLGGKACHILELDGIVAHRPIEQELSAQLSREFGELFPRRLCIETENDLLSLTFTSEWTECVAKYIIGIASLCSLDVNYAEKLYTDVQNKLKTLKKDFPIFAKLKERLPIRFSEIYIVRSKMCIHDWLKTKDQTLLSQLTFNLKKISPLLDKDYNVLLLRSIEAFLNGRRIQEAIDYAKKCKPYDDSSWHFSLAFLEAYKKNLVRCIRQYSMCARYKVAPIVISEVEDFINSLLKEEPDKYQYYYCLGLLNWKIKGDLHQAVTSLEEFLRRTKEGEFIKQEALARSWIAKIKKQIAERGVLRRLRNLLQHLVVIFKFKKTLTNNE
jgi:tetratricopeptide (TPR) repeat protein